MSNIFTLRQAIDQAGKVVIDGYEADDIAEADGYFVFDLREYDLGYRHFSTEQQVALIAGEAKFKDAEEVEATIAFYQEVPLSNNPCNDTKEKVMELKDNFVQVHKEQLKLLLELTEHSLVEYVSDSQLTYQLSKLRKHLKKFNPEHLQSDWPLSIKHQKHNQAVQTRRTARELEKCVGRKVSFKWQGRSRTGKILGRDFSRRNHIAVLMDPVVAWTEGLDRVTDKEAQVVKAYYAILSFEPIVEPKDQHYEIKGTAQATDEVFTPSVAVLQQ